jgi:hypothetical protein
VSGAVLEHPREDRRLNRASKPGKPGPGRPPGSKNCPPPATTSGKPSKEN